MKIKHWTRGGIAITAFREERRPIYEAAILEYGDPSLCIVEADGGFETFTGYINTTDPVLCQIGGVRKDLGPFWRIFDRIKNEVPA